MDERDELRLGCETAYIDGSVASNSLYCPQFITNNYKSGKKVLSTIENELLKCDKFQISVAFITMGGITPLLQTLKELEKKNIPGEILTTNYLDFIEPKALKKLNGLSNITLKMYDVKAADEGFHTKGYIFRTGEVYQIIIGSSNMTSTALTSNQEWNTRIISTEHGKMAEEIISEFDRLWNSQHTFGFDDFYENYKEEYNIVKHQRDIATQEKIVSLEKYNLKPNSMQIAFITNLKKIIDAGENRALLISATGTGKTYASAFAMRELGFKRVLFLVHRGQLARQTKKSYEKVFEKSVSMGLVCGGYREYDADYVFATVQTLNRDEHLLQYNKNAFDCIILDEAHHVTADTYQKIMKHFEPKLCLGMTATPDKRDDNIAGKNVYELFNYQIAYEIRLQQAMEDKLLCPFHYFGITDLSIIGDERLTMILVYCKFMNIRKKEKCMKIIKVVAAVIKSLNDKGQTIILSTQRGYGEFKDSWEFPGGKIENGETPQEALKREIMEELDTQIKVGTLIDTIEYDYPDFHLSMDCFWCEIVRGNLVLKEHENAKWLTKEQLQDVEWLPADIKLIENIRENM